MAKLGHADVRIIGVSKTHGPERVIELIKEGLLHFGENRVNEGRAKFSIVNETVSAESLPKPTYHHIGPLQSGNARQVSQSFHYAHGVSSMGAVNSLYKAVKKRLDESPMNPGPFRYLIQLNLTGEESKLGGLPESELDEMLKQMPNSEAFQFSGFMTMGPTDADPTRTRDVFRRLRLIRDQLLPQGELSMGMSGDYKIALEEGATMIRIGTMLFGHRNQPWQPLG